MGARRFEDLECWQLAHALKLEVYEILERDRVKRDFKFCDQIRDSAASATSNIAEGFGRFRPTEFARFLEIAKGSLSETQDRLIDARARQYVSKEEFPALYQLSDQAIGATTRLINYLRGRGKGGPLPPP